MTSSRPKTYSSKDGLRAKDPYDPILPLDRWTSFTRKLPYGVIKTGYKVSNDPLLLVPDPEKIFFIEQAFDHLQNGNTLRETAEWLSQKIHQTVSHQTLSNLYREYRKPFTFFKTEKKEGKKHSAETRKLIAEKNKAHAQVRKVEKLQAEILAKKKRLKEEDFPNGRPVVEKEPPVFSIPATGIDKFSKEKKKLFVANPGPQSDFLQATEREILYGGSAGGEG